MINFLIILKNSNIIHPSVNRQGIRHRIVVSNRDRVFSGSCEKNERISSS